MHLSWLEQLNVWQATLNQLLQMKEKHRSAKQRTAQTNTSGNIMKNIRLPKALTDGPAIVCSTASHFKWEVLC